MMRSLILLSMSVLWLWGVVNPAQAYHPVEEVTTPGGITAWLMPIDAQPVFTLRIAFKGAGSAYDGKEEQGLAALTGALLLEGTQTHDAEAFTAMLDALAIDLSISANRDYMIVELRSLTEHKDRAFALMAEALAQPALADDAIEKLKQKFAAQRRRQQQSPGYLAEQALFDRIYADHPYHFQRLGTDATMAALDKADFRRFVLNRLTQDRMTIAIAGDLDAGEAASLLETHLTALPLRGTGSHTLPEIVHPPLPPHIIEVEATQSTILFSLPGVKRTHPDFYAAYVLNHLLGGGGFAALMMQELRENHGFVYGASTYLAGMEAAPALMGQLSTRAEQTNEALNAMQALLREVQAGNITQQQRDDAVSDITGSLPLNLDTTQKMTAYLLSMQLHDLGRDYLEKRNSYFEAVTLADLKRLAGELLQPEKQATVIAMPAGAGQAGEAAEKAAEESE